MHVMKSRNDFACHRHCWRECTGKAGMFRRARIPQQVMHQDEDVVAEEELVKRMLARAQGDAGILTTCVAYCSLANEA